MISGETAARSVTTLMDAFSRGASADAETVVAVMVETGEIEGEASISFINLLISFDSCHLSTNDKDADSGGSGSAAELFSDALFSAAAALVAGTGFRGADEAVSAVVSNDGVTIFLVTTKAKAVAGSAVNIFFRTTSGRSEKPVSDNCRTSPEFCGSDGIPVRSCRPEILRPPNSTSVSKAPANHTQFLEKIRIFIRSDIVAI